MELQPNQMKFEELPRGRGLHLVNQHSVQKSGYLHKIYFNLFKDFIEPLVGFPHDDIVPIYNFSYATEEDDAERYEYSYEMQRLYPLTLEEREIIDYSYRNLGEEWEDKCAIVTSAKKNKPELYNFLSRVLLTLKYKDMHGGNVMKNKEGQFLMIDLEGFIT